MVSARFRHAWHSTTLDLSFEVPNTGITGVFGPSGSGKTSLLRVLAGLFEPKEAEVRVGDQLWQGPGVFTPAHERSIGYVFQEASLFPHMTVAENIAYGQRRVESTRINVKNVLQTLDIEHLMHRNIFDLSGGEQQRVALARALVTDPALMLLDEPLSALDYPLKQEILPFLARLKSEFSIPMFYVSHSADEIALLADHLLVLDQGKIVANGPVQETYPALGQLGEVHLAVLIEGAITDIDTEWHLATCAIPGGKLLIRSPGNKAVGDQTRIRVQARDVSLTLQAEHRSSILNRMAARIQSIEVADDPAMVVVKATVSDAAGETEFLAQITAKSAAELDLAEGKSVFLQIKSAAILG